MVYSANNAIETIIFCNFQYLKTVIFLLFKSTSHENSSLQTTNFFVGSFHL
jgi:hypothetical protein